MVAVIGGATSGLLMVFWAETIVAIGLAKQQLANIVNEMLRMQINANIVSSGCIIKLRCLLLFVVVCAHIKLSFSFFQFPLSFVSPSLLYGPNSIVTNN